MLYIITTKYCIFSVLQYVYIELLRNTEQQKNMIMGTLEVFLVIMAVISGGLVVWSYTKSGKKWLNSL
nr:MAG TPA: hypothetical protein [Caudoviricetes sp.]